MPPQLLVVEEIGCGSSASRVNPACSCQQRTGTSSSACLKLGQICLLRFLLSWQMWAMITSVGPFSRVEPALHCSAGSLRPA